MQDRHAGLWVAARLARFVGDVLRGADHALDHRVDRFEVARVRRQHHRHLDHLPVLAAQQPRAEVVFDVAGTIVGRIVAIGVAGRVACFFLPSNAAMIAA